MALRIKIRLFWFLLILVILLLDSAVVPGGKISYSSILEKEIILSENYLQ